MLDTQTIKKDFPLFRHDPSLVYLDTTATSLKPAAVIAALRRYYEEYSANIFRGIYGISEKATMEYEATREAVAEFIGASSAREIVFTRNTSESLNLVAYAFAEPKVGKHDEIVTTIAEHHSNFVPWQQLALRRGARLRIVGLTSDGKMEDIAAHINKNTKILALTYSSNVLGTVTAVKSVIAQAKRINPNITVVIDAAQAVPHREVDVSTSGADFVAFSSHKMLGPTGVGILWGKETFLKEMQPFLYGGEMIAEVTREKTVFKEPPHKFEAGTPSIAEVIALKEAVAYLKNIGMDRVEMHEREMGQRAADRLRAEFPGIHILGPEKRENGIVSFYFADVHAHDIAQVLSEENICVRAGHHCAMPLHAELAIDASVRASFYLYNEAEDIEKLVSGIRKALQILE